MSHMLRLAHDELGQNGTTRMYLLEGLLLKKFKGLCQ